MNMAELKALKEERKKENRERLEALRKDLDAYIAEHYVPAEEEEREEGM